MPISRTIAMQILSAGIVLSAAATARAADQPLTVVELFTSQGCSSCPPANANLIELARGRNILVLSFSVTYWDYLGWKDTNGREEFTARQVVYEPALGLRGPFTPQMVFNGRTSAVGNNLPEARELISRAEPLAGPAIAVNRSSVKIESDHGFRQTADIWLVRYDPAVENVPASRGENRGSTLAHTHVVHALRHLGTYQGEAVRLKFPQAGQNLRTAVLLQLPHGGALLSAGTDR
ncbi:DUF1223 domain-containing protein [Rhizobium daejeonense]